MRLKQAQERLEVMGQEGWSAFTGLSTFQCSVCLSVGFPIPFLCCNKPALRCAHRLESCNIVLKERREGVTCMRDEFVAHQPQLHVHHRASLQLSPNLRSFRGRPHRVPPVGEGRLVVCRELDGRQPFVDRQPAHASPLRS